VVALLKVAFGSSFFFAWLSAIAAARIASGSRA
jgi:hypothetical protein